MKILHLLPTFGYSAAGRQVALLAPALRSLAAALEIHVAALGLDGPFAESLRSADVPVHVLGSGRPLDPAEWWRLRRLLGQLRPDIVHTWRLPALRAAGMLRGWGKRRFRLIVGEPRYGRGLKFFDRWLLRSADAVVAAGPAEAAAIRRAGVAPDRIRQIPYAVVAPAGEPPPLDLPLPAAAKVVMCVGNLTAAHGFRDALWAADILRYVALELNIVIIGDGPERDRLDRFVRTINAAGRFAYLLPARSDAAALLARADVVWIPSRADCGRQILLEALAAGRPVVAANLPSLAESLEDGRLGMLTPPGKPTELARRTRSLLDDPALAARLGAAGREAAAAGFTPANAAAGYAELYGQAPIIPPS